MRPSAALFLLLAAVSGSAEDSTHEFNGHTKVRLFGQSFGDGDESLDIESDLRLNFSLYRGRWTFDTAYQLFALRGDNVVSPNDDARFLNLSDTINEAGKTTVAHRLDRLWVGYTNENTVVRFGRQALTWGNGLFYTPMDLVNPFNPAAIDTEFKSGDDMLYAQYLRDNGDDLQGAYVIRRDPVSGDVESNRATASLKYHGFAGEFEYDILLAESFDASVFGVGGARSVGGAILRGDLVVTEVSGDTNVQLVSNLTYAWSWGGKNVSGTVEYYYNEGTDFVAGSLLVELSPLWSFTPILLANASDRSALLQLVTNYSLSDNMTFLGSLNVPVGASGPEFGDPDAPVPGELLSVDWSVFAQLAWYF